MNKEELEPHQKSLMKHLPRDANIISTEVISYTISRHYHPRIFGTVRVTYTTPDNPNVRIPCLVKAFLKKRPQGEGSLKNF